MLSGEAVVAGEEIGAAIVVISVMGGAAIKASYRAHKKKVHDAEIAAINELHKDFLEEIWIKGEKLSLPIIFSFKKDKDGKVLEDEPQSIALSKQLLAELSNTNPVYSDPNLPRYGRHVLNAMSSLREFYKDRFDRDYWHDGAESDPESAVLAYLLLMLSTHCINFEGHEKATAYLDHIIKFCLNYSNKKGKEEKSDRYDHLKPVIVELRKAKYLLEEQMLSLSFKTILNEFLTDWRGLIEKMLLKGAFFISENDKWKYLDELTPKKIVEGIIKQGYPHFPGFNIRGRSPIHFEKTVLYDWLKGCAEYFLKILTAEDCSELNKKIISRENFDPKKITQQELKALTAEFKKCHNFITFSTQPNMTIKMAAAHVWLLLDMMEVYRFGTLVQNRAEIFGEIYMENPAHCVAIFKVLHGLGQRVTQSSSAQLMGIKNLEIMNVETVEAPEKETLRTETKDLIKSVHQRGVDAISALVNKHNERLKNKPEIPDSLDDVDAMDPAKDELYQMTHDLAAAFHIDITSAALLNDLRAEYVSASAGTEKPRGVFSSGPQPNEHKGALPDTPKHVLAPTLVVADPHPEVKEDANNACHEEKSQQASAVVPVPVVAPVKNAALKLAELHLRIEAIKQERADPKTSRYIAACVALFAENLRALQMWESRPAKYALLQDLVFNLADDMLEFLNKGLDERLDGAEAFAQLVDESLKKAIFLDKHELTIKQKLGLFKTESRKLANTIKETCDQIAVVTPEEEEGRQVHALGLSSSRVLT